MNIALRTATEADVPHLSRLYIMATGGLMNAAYADRTVEVPLEEIIKWRFKQLGSIRSYEHCLLAHEGSQIAGMLYAYPIARLKDAPSDPRLTGRGKSYLAPGMELLHRVEISSYYINAVAVYSDFRGCGLAKRLMAAAAVDAKKLGLSDLTLLCFEQNELAMPLYKNLNFETIARAQVVAHPLLQHAGDLLLMRQRL
jgi:ribosomal protein S18 acetylase RimI-like enzyme